MCLMKGYQEWVCVYMCDHKMQEEIKCTYFPPVAINTLSKFNPVLLLKVTVFLLTSSAVAYGIKKNYIISVNN